MVLVVQGNPNNNYYMIFVPNTGIVYLISLVTRWSLLSLRSLHPHCHVTKVIMTSQLTGAPVGPGSPSVPSSPGAPCTSITWAPLLISVLAHLISLFSSCANCSRISLWALEKEGGGNDGSNTFTIMYSQVHQWVPSHHGDQGHLALPVDHMISYNHNLEMWSLTISPLFPGCPSLPLLPAAPLLPGRPGGPCGPLSPWSPGCPGGPAGPSVPGLPC